MQSLKMDSFCELWHRCQSLGLLADHTTNEFQVVHQKGRNEAVQDPHSHDPCHLDNIRVTVDKTMKLSSSFVISHSMTLKARHWTN